MEPNSILPTSVEVRVLIHEFSIFPLIFLNPFFSHLRILEPLTLAPNQVIKGWTEAMQLMKEGAKWELYIPSELGYGDRGAGGMIPGGAALVFTMELLEVMGESQ